jgi:hypothetical protein
MNTVLVQLPSPWPWVAGTSPAMTAGAKTETLLKQLSHRFGGLPAKMERRVRKADAETLDRCALRVLDARPLREVAAN